MIRALGAGGAVRCIAVDATEVARHTAEVHGLGPSAAWLAAEALVANLLLSGHIKGEEQISLQLRTAEPEVHYYGQVTSDGVCRARLAPADSLINAPISGLLVAVKSIVRKELYRGAVAVENESLEAALSRYMASSAQIPAFLRLGASVDADGLVRFAGGLIVERLAEEPGMPWLDDEAFEQQFATVAERALETLVEDLMSGSLLGEPTQTIWQKPLVWQCRCTIERTEAALSAFGRAALVDMADEDGEARIECDFCGQVRTITGERLREIAKLLG